MKPQSAKAKGRKFQQWVAQKIADYLSVDCGPDAPVSSRGMGQGGTDIRIDKHLWDMWPFSDETKHHAKFAFYKHIGQAKANQREGSDWLLWMKQNRGEPVVVMSVDTFFRILEGGNGISATRSP